MERGCSNVLCATIPPLSISEALWRLMPRWIPKAVIKVAPAGARPSPAPGRIDAFNRCCSGPILRASTVLITEVVMEKEIVDRLWMESRASDFTRSNAADDGAKKTLGKRKIFWRRKNQAIRLVLGLYMNAL